MSLRGSAVLAAMRRERRCAQTGTHGIFSREKEKQLSSIHPPKEQPPKYEKRESRSARLERGRKRDGERERGTHSPTPSRLLQRPSAYKSEAEGVERWVRRAPATAPTRLS